MKKLGYVYKSINLKNNKLYIGKHVGRYNPRYFGSGKIIRSAIKKYGKSKFKLEVLVYSLNEEKLNELEKFYIKKYRKIFGKRKLYNISDGGEGGNNLVGPMPLKVRRKISKTLTGRKYPERAGSKNPACRPEVREKNRLSHIGKKSSLTTRLKMSKAGKGRKLPPRTEEHKRHLSVALKGRKSWCKGLTKEIDSRLKGNTTNHPKKISYEGRN